MNQLDTDFGAVNTALTTADGELTAQVSLEGSQAADQITQHTKDWNTAYQAWQDAWFDLRVQQVEDWINTTQMAMMPLYFTPERDKGVRTLFQAAKQRVLTRMALPIV